MTSPGDMIVFDRQWYWFAGFPPIDRWMSSESKSYADASSLPFWKRCAWLSELAPVGKSVLITSMTCLKFEYGIERDPALVQFLFDGKPYWVRAACWEHVHNDMRVVSSLEDAV